jgi:phosphatidylinositol glycan class O
MWIAPPPDLQDVIICRNLFPTTPDRGITLSAAFLLRHVIVWKVVAPRYTLGVVELLCMDVVVTVGLWLGVGRIVSRIISMLCVAGAERVYKGQK